MELKKTVPDLEEVRQEVLYIEMPYCIEEFGQH
jgi:hypothetical protein